jgi:hypothetical protein
MFRTTMRWAVAGMLLLVCSNGVLAAGPKQPDGSSATVRQNALLQKQLEAMRAAIMRSWYAAGYQGKIVVRIRLNRDGTLDGPPQVVSRPAEDPSYKVAATSAVRAVTLSQPFTMLGQESYDDWKDIEIEFVPVNFSR